jgi:hypothetical protein
MLTRTLAVLVTSALATVACVSSSQISPPTIAPQTPTTTVSSAPPTEPILGTWRMEYTCEALVRAFTRYGIPDQIGPRLATFGIHKSTTDESARSMCAGAKRFQRTHFFRPDGYLINYQGKQIVDNCHCYELIDNHTFLSLGGPSDTGGPGNPMDPNNVSLRYTIEGDTLMFDVVVPDRCSIETCREGIAFAVYEYSLGPWHRVS